MLIKRTFGFGGGPRCPAHYARLQRSPQFDLILFSYKKCPVAYFSSSSQEPTPPLTLWHKIKAELLHYWHGSRRFAQETRLSTHILVRSCKGHRIARREQLQLARTGADMIRLVPFSVFVIVPFLELLLPLFIKIFPGMLPSTFEADDAKQKRIKNASFARKAAGEALHSILLEVSAPSAAKGSSQPPAPSPPEILTNNHNFSISAKRLATVLEGFHISTASSPINERLKDLHAVLSATGKGIGQFSPDSLSGDHLLMICKMLGITSTGDGDLVKGKLSHSIVVIPGADAWRRFRLKSHLKRTKKDDKLIREEGVDSLLPAELYHACEKRGIQTHDKLSQSDAALETLRADLQQWLDLTGYYGFPMLLVVLSSVFRTKKNL